MPSFYLFISNLSSWLFYETFETFFYRKDVIPRLDEKKSHKVNQVHKNRLCRIFIIMVSEWLICKKKSN